MLPTPIEQLLENAQTNPDATFLLESHDESLSYAESVLLITELLPQRFAQLGLIDPTTRPSVFIISHNSSIFLLSFLSFWYTGARVIFGAVTSDPKLWPGMIRCSKANKVLVTRSMHSKLLQAFSEEQESPSAPVFVIEDLLPAEYHETSNEDSLPRLSRFISGTRRWISSHYSISTYTESIASYTPISRNRGAATMFTSSAVSNDTLKCVTFTYGMLASMMDRHLNVFGGEVFTKEPKRYLGLLPLTHVYEQLALSM